MKKTVTQQPLTIGGETLDLSGYKLNWFQRKVIKMVCKVTDRAISKLQ